MFCFWFTPWRCLPLGWPVWPAKRRAWISGSIRPAPCERSTPSCAWDAKRWCVAGQWSEHLDGLNGYAHYRQLCWIRCGWWREERGDTSGPEVVKRKDGSLTTSGPLSDLIECPLKDA